MEGGQEQCGEKSGAADKHLAAFPSPVWTGQVKNNVHYRVSLSNLNDFQLQAESILWTIFPFAGFCFVFI